MSKHKRVFLLVWISVATVCLLSQFVAAQFGYGVLPNSDEVEFSELFMCTGPNPNTGSPNPPVDSFILNEDKIFVCGYLISPVDAIISTAWFSEESERAFSRNIIQYSEGVFFDELLTENRNLAPGNYSVKLVYAHDALGNLNFQILDH